MTDLVMTNGLKQTLAGNEKDVTVELIDESGLSVKKSFTMFNW